MLTGILIVKRQVIALIALLGIASAVQAQTIQLEELELQRSLVSQVQAQRASLLRSLQQLQDAYCRAGQLDEALAVRHQLRKLQQDVSVSLPEVVNVAAVVRTQPSLGNSVFKQPHEVSSLAGDTFYCQVTGSSSGAVWGSGIYTADSALAAAAVHAGVLKPGETKVVSYRILPGQSEYAASSNHGVDTMRYGAWPSSFRISGAAPAANEVNLMMLRGTATKEIDVFVIGARPADSGLSAAYHEESELIVWVGEAGLAGGTRAGERVPTLVLDDHAVEPGRALGLERRPASSLYGVSRTIWGGKDGIYTDDSPVDVAAVHAGLVKAGEPAIITVELLPGQPQYQGFSQFDFASSSYGQWAGSFRLKKFHPLGEQPLNERKL